MKNKKLLAMLTALSITATAMTGLAIPASAANTSQSGNVTLMDAATETTDAPATETTDAPATETTDAPATESTDAPTTETTDAPVAATAATVSLNSDNKIVVTYGKDATAKVIKATYTGDVLSEVEIADVTLKNGETTTTLTAEAGDKIMVWDGFENMIPLTNEAYIVPTVTPTPTEEPYTIYSDQQVDLSVFDIGSTYDSATDTASITIGSSKQWSKLDLTPYTTKKGDHISKVVVTYTETVPSGGRSAIGFYDADEATWATNGYQDTTGSAVCYGVMGDGTNKRVYINNGDKITGTFSVDASESVSLTFDLDNETISGSIGSQSISGSISGLDSIDTFAIYSWSAMTYTISDMKITTYVSKDTYYTVGYSVNGTVTSESVIENGTVSEVPDTTNPGYNFMGWSTDGTSEYDSTKTYISTDDLKATPVTADVTYTAVYQQDTGYIEPIVSAVISGPTSMTFGSDTDTAADNAYTVTLTGEKGTIITSDTKDSRVTDMAVTWDIAGFKTKNDTDGQYCDSYGSFETNGTDATTVNFKLKQVSMNFYGKVTATIVYNGETYTATPLYVVALGNTATATNQVLPTGGYPSDFSNYPSALVGYTAATSSDNRTGTDIITDNFVLTGSDTGKTATLKEEDGVKYFNIVKTLSGKSDMFAHTLSLDEKQTIFKQRVRFNSSGATITFTTNYPIWNSNNKWAATFNMIDGTATLNDTPLVGSDGTNTAAISTGAWYDLVISLDPTSSLAWAKIYSVTDNSLVGEVSNVAFTNEGTVPTYYAVGMGNSYTGNIDFAGYEAYYPTADESKFELSATQTTLSIPNGDTSTLTASLQTADGYDITSAATWTVQEDDMKEGVIVTPSGTDSHTATVTLADTASAGTATVQVSIAGYTKTIELNITSSAESVKFTQSTSSISIPMDSSSTSTATYAAKVIDGNGDDVAGVDTPTLAVYDKTNTNVYTLPTGITFDAATGVLTVTNEANPAVFYIRATGQNSSSETITKSVKVTVHGLSFDFGSGSDGSLVEGYTEVTATTAYSETLGYGISAGTTTAGGTTSDTDATTDYLEGSFTFKANVTKGKLYNVTIYYSGTLASEYVNSDLSGVSQTNETASSVTYTIPVIDDVLDLTFTSSQVSSIVIEKVADKSANAKPHIYTIGDSTIANNGSWAYVLNNTFSSYTALSAIATFSNNGRGSRNLCSYYTEGMLNGVLTQINPGDYVMIGDMGTNGMGSDFETDFNYYIDACEAMGAKVILNSYTPHGAIGDYASVYDSTKHTFASYRTDSYDVTVRAIYAERSDSSNDAYDENVVGFVDIGKNADAAFNAYVADYAANGYADEDAAAQAIISCFSDHNHYSNGTIACKLMLEGYGNATGIVPSLVSIIGGANTDAE